MKTGKRTQEEQEMFERKLIDTYILKKGITKVDVAWKPQDGQTGLRMRGQS